MKATDPGHSKIEIHQVFLSAPELKLIEEWRVRHNVPSRAAALRNLIGRGLDASRSEQMVCAAP